MVSKTDNIIFRGLNIIAWLIFVGLCIEAGGLLVNFVFSLYKPEMVKNLYQKLDLSGLYNYSRNAFFGAYASILTIAVLKAMMFYVVIRLMLRMDLSNPFSNYVSKQILLISYFTLAIGLISYIARQSAQQLAKNGVAVEILDPFWTDSRAFILMGAVVYIIAAIFKRGVEIQHENELTV